MKTIDYIQKYRLDKNNKSLSKLEKDEFFKDLEKRALRKNSREGEKLSRRFVPQHISEFS